MSPTPIDQLARRAGEAVRVRADQVDARRPHVDGLRRRHRTRRVLTAGTAMTVLVVALTMLVPARPGSLPVIGDGIGPHPDERHATEDPTDDGTPEPMGDRVRVAEGVHEGSDQSWVMRAWLTEPGVVCIELHSLGCGAIASADDPLAWVGTSTARGSLDQGCVYGGTAAQVAAVEVDFLEGETITLSPLDGQQLPIDFYAHCWEGQRQPTGVRALDELGRVLASVDVEPAASSMVESAPHS